MSIEQTGQSVRQAGEADRKQLCLHLSDIYSIILLSSFAENRPKRLQREDDSMALWDKKKKGTFPDGEADA